MPTTKWLDAIQLRYLAGDTVFFRGEVYFRQGRVALMSYKNGAATLAVQGTAVYNVEIRMVDDQFHYACSCPYAADHSFCKHMVAAGLFLVDFMKQGDQQVRWKAILDKVLELRPREKKQPIAEYFLFFSLHRSFNEIWRINPVILPSNLILDREHNRGNGEFPDEQAILNLLENNPSIAERARVPKKHLLPSTVINASPGLVSLANMFIQSERGGTYYAQEQPYQSLNEALDLLLRFTHAIFIGDYYNPLKTPLQILDSPGELEIELLKDDAGIRVMTQLRHQRERVIKIFQGMVTVISTEPTWIIFDRLLLCIKSALPSDIEKIFIDHPNIFVPSDQEAEFMERYLFPMAGYLPIIGDQLEVEDIVHQPKGRLYLFEEDGVLKAEFRIAYGEYEVPFEINPNTTSIQKKKSDAWTLVKVIRNPAWEKQTHAKLNGNRYGLKLDRGIPGNSIFTLRSNIDPVDFLISRVPALAQDGFEVFGEENIKTVRVNRKTPTISISVTSGLDWLDVRAKVSFGNIGVSLQEIRRAIRKQTRYVKLADGTVGQIPDDWLNKYKHLFGLGQQTDYGARFQRQQIFLVDRMFEDASVTMEGSGIELIREQLKSFSGIVEKPLPAKFVGELRHYQRAGYDWLHFLRAQGFGGCLADDMGLGKTVQILAFLQSVQEQTGGEATHLVVVPRSLLVNWQREINRFTPDLRVMVHFGSNRLRKPEDYQQYDLILTTYGTMLRDIQSLRIFEFDTVVLDESQVVKNPVSQISKAVRLLRGKHRLVMTGTPIENRTAELWSQFSFLSPGFLGSMAYFKREFVLPIEKKGDQEAAELLRRMVYPFILRRTKDQVAPELPEKSERTIYCDMEVSQQKLYHRTRDYFRGMLLGLINEQGMDSSRIKVLEGLLRLRQICDDPRLVEETFRGRSGKMEVLLETLNTLNEERHKALIFSQFVKMLRLVAHELDRQQIPYAYLDGQTRNRQEQVDRFQNDPKIPFFLISLKAGGVGLNLTAADYVIHVDPWWNPAVEMQATDRTHRIGQDKPVFVYKLVTRDTVEEKIIQLQERKRALIDQLITSEDEFFKQITEKDVQVLFS